MEITNYDNTQVRIHETPGTEAERLASTMRAVAEFGQIFGETNVSTKFLAETIMRAFGKLATVVEIVEAANIAATAPDKIGLTKEDVTLYGKPLNVQFVSTILRAYLRYKRAAQDVDAIAGGASPAPDPDYWKKAAMRIFENPGLQFCAVPIYNLLHKCGMISISEEEKEKMKDETKFNVLKMKRAKNQKIVSEGRPKFVWNVDSETHSLRNEYIRLAVLHTFAQWRRRGAEEFAKKIGLDLH